MMAEKIDPDATVLDILAESPQTEIVFKGYDAQAGECICCQALFEPLRVVAQKYDLNLKQLLSDLESAVQNPK